MAVADDVSAHSAVGFLQARRIVHRDLSPWNVFINGSSTLTSTLRQAKIGDFGLAVRIPVERAELCGWYTTGVEPLDDSAIGSLYSAPELGSEVRSLMLICLCAEIDAAYA